jgi:hypothetical protein
MTTEEAKIHQEGDWLVVQNHQKYVTETVTGLSFIKEPPPEVLMALAQVFSDRHSTHLWQAADLLVEAMRLDGGRRGKTYGKVVGQFPPREQGTLYNWVFVAQAWPLVERLPPGPGTQFTHHKALASCTGEEKRKLIRLSQEHGWSVSGLLRERDTRFPRYKGKTTPQFPGDEETEQQQAANELAHQLYQEKMRAADLQAELEQAKIALAQAGLSAPPSSPNGQVPPLLTGLNLPVGKLLPLPQAKEELFQLFFIDDHLGCVHQGERGISWYKRDDPVSKWLARRWREC